MEQQKSFYWATSQKKCSCSLTWQEKPSARKFIHDNRLHTSNSIKIHLQTTVKAVSHFWQEVVGHHFGNNVCQKICFVNISTHVSSVHPWQIVDAKLTNQSGRFALVMLLQIITRNSEITLTTNTNATHRASEVCIPKNEKIKPLISIFLYSLDEWHLSWKHVS